jgi:hypothetical protein
MLIDCDTCSAQGLHCHDCVVTVLLNSPPQRLELDSDEQIALVRLADAGLVPPLRLVPDPPGRSTDPGPPRRVTA